MLEKTQCLILRATPYKDHDLILTALARGEGKLTISARGARRGSCRYVACVQLLAFSEMTLFSYKNRARLNDAELLDAFMPLREDLGLMTLGAYAAELCEALAPEGLAADELLDVTLNTLFALCRWPQQRERLKASFELRLLSLTGYEPSLEHCAVCGESVPREPCLHLHQGLMHCASCRAGLPRGISLPLPPGTLMAMRYLVSCPPKRLFSFSLDGEDLRALAHVCEAYLHAQLERGFQTLDFYKKISL